MPVAPRTEVQIDLMYNSGCSMLRDEKLPWETGELSRQVVSPELRPQGKQPIIAVRPCLSMLTNWFVANIEYWIFGINSDPFKHYLNI